MKRIDELSNMEWIDKEKVIEAVEKYKDVIVGLKARMSKSVPFVIVELNHFM